ncbi:MAG: hypothetical protein WDO16_18825 [Bacteroidota bacterium]
MNKTLKWVLIIVVVIVAVGFIAKAALGKDKSIKVSTEKAAKRTIIETVTASGNIYPKWK